jgi:hypothetical protein
VKVAHSESEILKKDHLWVKGSASAVGEEQTKRGLLTLLRVYFQYPKKSNR